MSIDTGFEVAVTGIGAVTPFGMGAARLWEKLALGRDAFAPITIFSPEGHRTRMAAQVGELPAYGALRLDQDRLSRADVMALHACREALLQAGLLGPGGSLDTGLADGLGQDLPQGPVQTPDGRGGSNRMGLAVATAAGGILGLEDFFQARARGTACDPTALLSSFALSALATNLAKEFGIQGPRATLATVCSSSGVAMALAFEMLSAGEVDRVLVVGAESLSRVTHAGFNSLRSIDPERCRPFDVNRRGLVLGEGAGALVLERRDLAEARNRPVLARFSGYGFTTDTHHFTAPDPEGQAVAQTMREALLHARVRPQDVGYVNVHGTGTPLNDAAECKGVVLALTDGVGLPGVHGLHGLSEFKVSSTKSMTGHLLGAASAVEAVVTVPALQSGIAPPTANLDEPCPECQGLDLVAHGPKAFSGRAAISNSFAFGGSNVSLVFTAPELPIPIASPQPPEARVVISGLGMVSPFGVGKAPFAQAMADGRSGVIPLDGVSPEWAALSGGMADLAQVRQRLAPARRRHLNRLGCFLEVAVAEAIEDAGLAGQASSLTMAFGSAFGCSNSVDGFYTQMLSEGPSLALPQMFMLSVTNAPAALTAQALGIRNPVWVFVADEASFDLALHWAARLVRRGRAERVMVAAADEIGDSILAIHRSLGFFAPPSGLTLGEGALCLVVESENSAKIRGARPYGLIESFATAQDTAMGPLEFSADPALVVQTAGSCLDRLDDPGAAVACTGPGNGLAKSEGMARQALHSLATHWPGLSPSAPRALLGESGVTSGFSLAAAMLARKAPYALSLTSARGGILAATLLRLDQEREAHG